MRETVRTNDTVTAVMDFIYDESGTPFALKYSTNGGSSFTTYYYVVNLQGDVVKLVNASGTSVAEYTYNAWGEVLTSTGEKASINPLRYRGYYYDTETGFYYLQSRYYDPVTHRFINTDAPEYSTMSAYGLNNSNLFAYCQNNPVAYGDENGEWLHLLIEAVVGAVVNAVAATIEVVQKEGWDAFSEGETWAKIGVSAATGAASGALAASGVGIVGSIAGSAAISMASNAAGQVIDNHGFDDFDVGDMLFDGAVGAVCGAWGGQGASYGNTAGIMSAGKKMMGNLTSRSAWRYYSTQAHRKGGEYVLKELGKSLGKSAFGVAITTYKNITWKE